MGTILMKCKSWGASLEINDEKQIMFCPYSGSKEFIEESDSVKQQRIKSDAYKTVEIGKQYFENEKNKREYSFRMTKFKAATIGIIVAIVVCVGLFCHPIRRFSNAFLPHKGKIQVTVSGISCDGKTLEAAETEFRAMGFSNITTSHQPFPLATLVRGEGESVFEVSIDGDSGFIKGDWFDPDAVVVISYY